MIGRLCRAAVACALALSCGASFASSYAVIFNGGGYDWTYNYWPFYNETKRLYCTLTGDYGYLDENVFVLQSDGLSTGADRRYLDDAGNRSARNSPIDIDGDGDTDVYGPGTQAALLDVFSSLSSRITPDDFFLFACLDHGAKDGNLATSHQYIVPWHYGSGWDDHIQDAELDAWCDQYIAASNQVYLFGQCYSGGFINDLQQAGRIIFASSEYNKVSYCEAYAPSSDEDYMGFVRAWWQAIDLDEGGAPNPDADGNDDGYVTMDEAWAYALANDPFYQHPEYPETPQFSDLAGLASRISLTGAIPEPATVILFCLGAARLALLRRRARGG